MEWLEHFLEKRKRVLARHTVYGFVTRMPVIWVNQTDLGNRLEVVWFDAEKKGQHSFPLEISPDDFIRDFGTSPEVSSVVFLGKVKDIPDKKMARGVMREIGGNDENVVIYGLTAAADGRGEKGFLTTVQPVGFEEFIPGLERVALPLKYDILDGFLSPNANVSASRV